MSKKIELLFKLLKSELLVDESRSSNPQRRLSEILAKLLGALVQHWFVLLTAWQDLELSLVLVSRAVRSCLALIVLFMRDDLSFEALRDALRRSVSVGCSLDKCRLSPSSAQLMMTIKGLT